VEACASASKLPVPFFHASFAEWGRYSAAAALVC